MIYRQRAQHSPGRLYSANVVNAPCGLRQCARQRGDGCRRGSAKHRRVCLARRRPGRRLGLQARMAEDLLDDRPLDDRRDDLQLPGSEVRTVLHVDVENTLEQPRPANLLWPGGNGLDLGFADGIGDITKCVMPSPHAVFCLSSACPAALSCTRWSDNAGRVMYRHSCSIR